MDQHLLNSYLSTRYLVFYPSLEIQIGRYHPKVDQFLMDNNAFSWAFVSACNPFSKLLPDLENEQRHAHLVDYLEELHYLHLLGQGKGVDGDWPPEKSLLVLNISRQKAMQLAKKFEQNAIVFGTINQKAELIITR